MAQMGKRGEIYINKRSPLGRAFPLKKFPQRIPEVR